MLVPRSYLFTSSSYSPSSRDNFDETRDARNMLARRKTPPKTSSPSVSKPSAEVAAALPRVTSDAPTRTPTQPVAVPTSPDRRQAAHPRSMSAEVGRAPVANARTAHTHDPDSMPPAVAALLAMTTIPRPKPNQFRRRPIPRRKISIDELVSEWKADELSKSSLSISPALDLLLEDADDGDEQERQGRLVFDEDGPAQSRSISADSVPSLDADDKSVLSTASLCTPVSLRSNRSYSNLRNAKRLQNSRIPETCPFDHPLIERNPDEADPDEGFIIASASRARSLPANPRSSFKSNLTASLQAFKKAAISSITSLSLSNTASTAYPQGMSSPPFSDDMLWSHPFLFPRMTTEIRPAAGDKNAEAQRRYCDPPLNFEEQEAPYQQALHAPYLAEHRDDMPSIPMQTYTARSVRRKAGGCKGQRLPDPTSEAGRALCGAHSGLRPREPRENSDFLRVIVMEMNMRREGKLEVGRARIWLPPRLATPPVRSPCRKGEVPRRWEAWTAD